MCFAPSPLSQRECISSTLEAAENGWAAELMGSMKPRADEIATDTGAFATNQFGNPDVLRATGHWPTNFSRNCQDRLQSTFGSFVGSADCFAGATCERVREVPDLWRVVVEPAESAVLSGDQQAHTTSRVVASDIDRPS
jgi:hypothetical protein